MILGCSYNVFDGEELLEYSINSLRNNVDYISVVYQKISNYGEKLTEESLNTIHELKGKGLIDELIEFKPIIGNGHINEINKRNIGLKQCKSLGCTHFMTIDTDELYESNQFKFAKDLIELNDLESTACQMQTYYKYPNYVLTPPETYYVPFIYKLDNRVFQHGISWPVLADPTRKMKPDKFYAFDRKDLEMHHMSYVRKDIRRKLNNSSASSNFKFKIEKIINHWLNWTPGEKALFAGKEDRYYDVKQVENIFNIDIFK